MKKIQTLSILPVLVMMIMSLASCMSDDSFDGVELDEQTTAKQAPVTSMIADLSSQLGGTKGIAANSSYKTAWTENDFVRVYNNGDAYMYAADAEGMAATFSVAGGNTPRLSGAAYAFYPSSVNLMNGQGEFSLNGQKGKFEELNRYFLMTSAAQVEEDGYLPFSFNEHISVLAISMKGIQYPDARVKNVVISGNGVSSKLAISAQNGQIRVSGADNSAIEVLSPVYNGENTFFVAIYNEGAQDVNIDIMDDMDGHFFATVSGSRMSAGQITNIFSSELNGGYSINFSADVADWNDAANSNI